MIRDKSKPNAWTPRSRQRWFGRLRGAKGAASGVFGGLAGRALGGRPPDATPEQQQEMLRLSSAGLSTRAIAERVFGDAKLKDRVSRFLRR
jgi:DNA-binding NarL/FixJ family response regulator